jgi:hypothetical protein
VAEFNEPGEPVPTRAQEGEPFQVIARWGEEHELPMTVYTLDKEGDELRFHEMLRTATWRGIVQCWGEPDSVEIWTLEEWVTRE